MSGPFSTERLVLRRWRLEDAEAALAIYGDAEVMRYIGDGSAVGSPAAMEARIAERIERFQRQFDYRMGAWLLWHRKTDELIGCVLLKPLPGSADVEIGWHLARRHWGNGYATEAGRAAIAYGFRTLHLPEIHAVVDPCNDASMQVCRRLGMAHHGLASKYYERTLEWFSRKRNDWSDKRR